MKICFNLFPPANKLIAILVCILLFLAYTRSKAENRITNVDGTEFSFVQKSNDKKHSAIKSFYNINQNK